MAETNSVQNKSQDETMGIIAHVLNIVVGFIGPLIIYLVAEDKTSKEHAKKALNWAISVVIYSIVSGILVFVFIGIALLVVVMVLNIIFPIMAAVKASEGKVWDYPLAIKFIK